MASRLLPRIDCTRPDEVPALLATSLSLRAALLVGLAASLTTSCDSSVSSDAPTVLLISLDTTRADRLGSYGRSGANTPVLDALAARGVRFERAYATAPITLPSHSSLMTGLVPPVHGLRDNGIGRLSPQAVTAAELFAEAGWRTAAFVAAFPLESNFGLDQGFEVYDDAFGQRAAGSPYDERRASSVVDGALSWLAQLGPDEPAFLWTHVFDPHRPWVVPGTELGEDAAYQAEIAFVDAQLGRLIQALDDAGRGEQLSVLVVADHGEGLGEHGESSHGVLLHDATLRVPMLLSGPGIPAGRLVETPVSVVDVLPTLATLHGLPTPQDLQGRDLSAAWSEAGLSPRPVYAESLLPERHHGWSPLEAWIDGDLKLVGAPRAESRRWELFDLGQDSAEDADVAALREAEVRRLAADLGAFLDRLPEALPSVEIELDADDVAERLAALGYVSSDVDASLVNRHPADMVGLLAFYHEGRTLARAGRIEEAQERLDGALALEPDGFIALELRAELAIARGKTDPEQLELARLLLLEATSRGPTRKGLWRRLSQVQRRMGDLRASLLSMDRCLAVGEPTAELLKESELLLDELERRAFEHEDAAEFAEALGLWELVLERRPEDRAASSARDRVAKRLQG